MTLGKKRKIKKIQDSRSDRAKSMDLKRKAKITSDVDKWVKNPNRLDMIGVDAPKRSSKRKDWHPMDTEREKEYWANISKKDKPKIRKDLKELRSLYNKLYKMSPKMVKVQDRARALPSGFTYKNAKDRAYAKKYNTLEDDYIKRYKSLLRRLKKSKSEGVLIYGANSLPRSLLYVRFEFE